MTHVLDISNHEGIMKMIRKLQLEVEVARIAGGYPFEPTKRRRRRVDGRFYGPTAIKAFNIKRAYNGEIVHVQYWVNGDIRTYHMY